MSRKIKLLIVIVLMSATLLVACASEQPAKQDNEKITQFNKLDEEDAAGAQSSDEAFDQSLIGLSAPNRTGVNIYFLDEIAGQLSPETRNIKGNETNEELAYYILEELTRGPQSSGLNPVIPDGVKINRLDITEDILAVDLSAEFNESEEPALARAALVNSLLDMEAFKYVKLYIDGREATVTPDNESGPLGLLTRYPIIAAEIIALEEQNFNNDLRKINWELFFRDNSGKYLLSEIRPITIKKGKAAETIVNELIKGPIKEGEGYYSTLPKGTVLQNTELINGLDDKNGIALFFSEEFRTNYPESTVFEESMISSLIYSLTSLPDIQFVKIYYDNGKGHYIDDSVNSAALYQELTRRDYPDNTGRRIRVYFGNDQSLLLTPEYRAIAGNEEDIAACILEELATDPTNSENVRVLPNHVPVEDIDLDIKGELAVVDIPLDFFDEMEMDNKKMIRDLYAFVNSLTDPMNKTGIKEVQFTVEGKVIESYMGITLKDTFVMNPALISET